MIKKSTGNFIDKEHSNYWKKAVDIQDDSFESGEPRYVFNWKNLWMVSLTQGLTALGGLILVAYAFKFALLAEMN